jgi:hypothetical protein
MECGVRNSDAVLLFLSDGFFTRDFCRFEVSTAIRFAKPLILVHETDPRHGRFSFSDEITKAKVPSEFHEVANLLLAEYRSEAYHREEHHAEVMIRMIKKQADNARERYRHVAANGKTLTKDECGIVPSKELIEVCWRAEKQTKAGTRDGKGDVVKTDVEKPGETVGEVLLSNNMTKGPPVGSGLEAARSLSPAPSTVLKTEPQNSILKSCDLKSSSSVSAENGNNPSRGVISFRASEMNATEDTNKVSTARAEIIRAETIHATDDQKDALVIVCSAAEMNAAPIGLATGSVPPESNGIDDESRAGVSLRRGFSTAGEAVL